MIDRTAAWMAEAAGARLAAGDPEAAGARRAVTDSREAGPGDLFVGIPGARADGGEFAPDTLRAGAWGVLVAERHAERAAAAAGERAGAAGPGSGAAAPGVVLATPDPVAALGRLARAWRRELGCTAIGVTGSTGKTSTKDILAALLAPRLRTHANRENLNTEIGLPLALLEAPRGTEALVLEMAMRGEGQIAELAAIAEPDVGVIVNVGPVHLELLGTVERVAAAKAELIRDLQPGASCVIPADEPLLEAYVRDDVDTITFGPDGDVRLERFEGGRAGLKGGPAGFEGGRAQIDAHGTRVTLELPYAEPHNLLNTLAAVAATTAVGVVPEGRVDVRFSSMRGELVELVGGVTVVNDCYNANPMSMRAALDHLAASPADRRIAVLGEMAELGPDTERFHRDVGGHAQDLGIDVLVTVGGPAMAIAAGFDGETYPVGGPEEAGALLAELTQPGDRVLIKGSRSAGLERVLS